MYFNSGESHACKDFLNKFLCNILVNIAEFFPKERQRMKEEERQQEEEREQEERRRRREEEREEEEVKCVNSISSQTIYMMLHLQELFNCFFLISFLSSGFAVPSIPVIQSYTYKLVRAAPRQSFDFLTFTMN